MEKIMVQNTHSKDDVERASLAFVVANTALSAGQEATVLLTIDGVRVATKGYADGLQAKGFGPLNDLVTQFVTNHGRLWVCGACAKPRDITAEDLVPGAEIVGAANVVEAMANGARVLSF
jgi:predicted peroxiredoxin